jgi:hypothetical protein
MEMGGIKSLKQQTVAFRNNAAVLFNRGRPCRGLLKEGDDDAGIPVDGHYMAKFDGRV